MVWFRPSGRAGGRPGGVCAAGGLGARAGARATEGARGLTTAALDKLLRHALEAAVAVARAGEEATPVVPAPVPLRPFLQFAKLPARAVDATRRAIDTDDDFRARVAEVVAEDDVGRAGWLWLTRPPGWEGDLESLQRGVTEAGAADADRRVENEARRRLAGAEAAVKRAEAAAATAAGESARAAAALAEERRDRRAATQEAQALAAQLEQVGTERDRARADRDRVREEANRAQQRAAELKRSLDDLRDRPPAPPLRLEPTAPDAPAPDVAGERLRAAASALLAAASAAGAMAASLQTAALAMGAEAPTPPPSASGLAPGLARIRRPKPPRRAPAPIPPGVLDDSVEAADHLVRVPGMTLLVDGYNASQTGWPELTIAEQRRRLTDALAELVARTGVDVSVVFDGADLPWPAAAPTTARLVKVGFSPVDVEADDVILERVAALPPSRPVLVASSDRRVRDGSAAMGANVISSPQLLGALRR